VCPRTSPTGAAASGQGPAPRELPPSPSPQASGEGVAGHTRGLRPGGSRPRRDVAEVDGVRGLDDLPGGPARLIPTTAETK